MPTKIKSKRKFKRKYIGKKSYKYMTLRKKMKKIAKSTMNANRAKKEADFNVSGSLNTAGSFTDITAVFHKGIELYQREGDEIYLRKVQMRYQITTVSSYYQTVRLLLVASRPGVNSPVNLSQIFTAEDYTVGGPVVSYMNDLVDTRYYIPLYDKTVTVNASNAASVNGNTVNINKSHITTLDTVKIYKKLKYTRNSANGSSPLNFKIFWVVFYGGDVVSTAPSLNGLLRIHFMDVA